MNNNWFCEDIRATNPCGEQPLPPYGSCLLGSVNLTKFVLDPFTDKARFDWDDYREVVAVFTRMLDNVVEINGLPLAEQRDEIMRKRRHGMGYSGAGLHAHHAAHEVRRTRIPGVHRTGHARTGPGRLAHRRSSWPGKRAPRRSWTRSSRSPPRCCASARSCKRDGFKVGDKRARQASCTPNTAATCSASPRWSRNWWTRLAEVGCRFTHHSSIAPTGTISLSLANNASNGIEPSFAHHYSRNVIREGRKTKEKVDVFSFELLAYRELVNARAPMPYAEAEEQKLPEYFITAEQITPKQHVDIQAAAQKWIDSSISKTANVPTDYPYEDFKDIYLYAYEKGLKGCTTFRFNPEAFQGVLVQGQGPGKHHLPLRARRRQDGGTQGQRRGGVRRGDAHRRQSIRRVEGGLLWEVLTSKSAWPDTGP